VSAGSDVFPGVLCGPACRVSAGVLLVEAVSSVGCGSGVDCCPACRVTAGVLLVGAVSSVGCGSGAVCNTGLTGVACRAEGGGAIRRCVCEIMSALSLIWPSINTSAGVSGATFRL